MAVEHQPTLQEVCIRHMQISRWCEEGLQVRPTPICSSDFALREPVDGKIGPLMVADDVERGAPVLCEVLNALTRCQQGLGQEVCGSAAIPFAAPHRSHLRGVLGVGREEHETPVLRAEDLKVCSLVLLLPQCLLPSAADTAGSDAQERDAAGPPRLAVCVHCHHVNASLPIPAYELHAPHAGNARRPFAAAESEAPEAQLVRLVADNVHDECQCAVVVRDFAGHHIGESRACLKCKLPRVQEHLHLAPCKGLTAEDNETLRAVALEIAVGTMSLGRHLGLRLQKVGSLRLELLFEGA
mmetsp:Transcript_65488/g.211172  ORF Transcript_65488/g.211172 Transcript_65488/m.211172 type:complete len:298 (-) Transcript_65488:304-1197(-)